MMPFLTVASRVLILGLALSPAVTAQIEPFVATIETIKQSVVPMDCISASPDEAKILKRVGTAFLISELGDFLTAAHVIEYMEKDAGPCKLAFTVPVGGWQEFATDERMFWFPFKKSDCEIDSLDDVAKCRLSEDLQADISKLHLKAVKLERGIPPDGAQLAFSGFPLEIRDPMTFRGHLAAYRGVHPKLLKPELIVDHPALPGFSGAPVYMVDGNVVGVLVGDGRSDAPGTTVVRPVQAFYEKLSLGK
jgi:hypothetical protein